MDDKSNHDRVLTIKAGMGILSRFPFFGAGFNNSSKYYYRYGGQPLFQTNSNPYDIHNAILKLASDLGLIGLLAFGAGIFAICKSLIKIRSISDKYYKTGLLTLYALLSNSVTIPASYKDLYILMFVITACFGKNFNPSLQRRKVMP